MSNVSVNNEVQIRIRLTIFKKFIHQGLAGGNAWRGGLPTQQSRRLPSRQLETLIHICDKLNLFLPFTTDEVAPFDTDIILLKIQADS